MVQRDTQYPKCIGLGASSGVIAGGEHIPRHFLFKGVRNEGIKYFYRWIGWFRSNSKSVTLLYCYLAFSRSKWWYYWKYTRLKQWLLDASINDEYIHTHPIIRKEDPYHNLSIDERRKILNKMLRFTMGCPIKYFNIIVNKRECKDKHSLSANIAKQLSRFIDENSEFFYGFERIAVYYDNGQSELSYILNAILNSKLSLVEFKTASPKAYHCYRLQISFVL